MTSLKPTKCNLNSFGVVSILPQVFKGWMENGIPGRAFSDGRISLSFENPRDYSQRSSATVDDRPYGGGPGMVMQIDPVIKATDSLAARLKSPKRILLAPHGRIFDYKCVTELLNEQSIIFICGRYEGIDCRIEQDDDIEVYSVGNFVLSGGELAAMIIMESLARHISGVLGDDESARQDSFFDKRLDYPHYTRPMMYDNSQVPDVLLKGNHGRIQQWRKKQAYCRMWHMRPDLMHNLAPLELEYWDLLYEYIQETGKC